MSQVKISGNASGTGVLTIQAPNTDTDRTINIPDNAGDIITTGSSGVTTEVPMFRAWLSSNQTLSNATNTTIQFADEDYDSHGWYDTSTYRFTPQLAGYYVIACNVGLDVVGSNYTLAVADLRINGATTGKGSGRIILSRGSNHNEVQGCFTNIVYLNGSTDYVSASAYLSSGGTRQILGYSLYANTMICGYLLRTGSI